MGSYSPWIKQAAVHYLNNYLSPQLAMPLMNIILQIISAN
jgi:hypothetical protein